MSRTERRRWTWRPDGSGSITPDARDHGTDSWCCTRWRRVDRRKRRHQAKADLRAEREVTLPRSWWA